MVKLPMSLERLAQSGVVISCNYFSDSNKILIGEFSPHIFAVGPALENIEYEYIFHLKYSDRRLTFIRPAGRRYPLETVIHLGFFPRYFLYDTLKSMYSKFVKKYLDNCEKIKLDDYNDRIKELGIV